MKGVLAAVLAAAGGCASGAAPPDEVALERFEAGNALVAAGRLAEAVPHYEFAVSNRDRFKEAYYRLAYCHEVLGDESRAVGTYEKVLRVDKVDERALRELGRLYTHRGLLEQAIGAYKVLGAGDPAARAELQRLEALKGKP